MPDARALVTIWLVIGCTADKADLGGVAEPSKRRLKKAALSEEGCCYSLSRHAGQPLIALGIDYYCLVASQGGESIRMEVIVAISLSTDRCAFHEKADVELISHANTAVHLNGLFGCVAHNL